MATGDIAIEDTGGGVWDIVLEDGDYKLTTEGSVSDVAQKVVYAWMTWLGESPYNTNQGLPHDQILGSNEPIEGISGLYALAAQEVPGVDELVQFDFVEPTAAEFKLQISATIRVGQTDAEVLAAVGAP